MTEVPEHLLRRSRERREALGLGGGGGGESAPATTGAAPAPAAAAEAPSTADVEDAAASAAPEPVVVEVVPPRPRPPATRVPVWVASVLAVLPMWGFFYLGAFGDRAHGPVERTGAQIYSNSCASCHGGAGEGGVGPAMSGGAAKLTFPNEADHISWVENGSAAVAGQPYGARGRTATGGMPPFKGTLSDEDIRKVVAYERGL